MVEDGFASVDCVQLHEKVVELWDAGSIPHCIGDAIGPASVAVTEMAGLRLGLKPALLSWNWIAPHL